MSKTVQVGKIKFGNGAPFVLIAGPCVIENRNMAFSIAKTLQRITSKLGVPFVFKASYDKANRTSIDSFRGLGLRGGLDILGEIRSTLKIPVTTDVHSPEEIEEAASVVDILQIPAFLCRQTDLLLAAGKTGKVVNVKKGQFLAPWDIKSLVKKIETTGNHKILLTERGVSFGYNTLVSDFRSLAIMRRTGYPVVFDASHSVQQPGGLGTVSGGQSEFIPLLARCAVAAGCDAVFMETHPNPKKALSDGPNMLPLNTLEKLLKDLKAIDGIVKK
ncbi:MAG: 3-deoxy-8-phosphooctulonate synthase [Omnitrophica WOR_2 bacterium GWA2_47_8]|nr:MAG: 3-deoxy-8-phosphooctulonate synthase [Omnitrophica WOR_2 bacterium GWA2_47_8]